MRSLALLILCVLAPVFARADCPPPGPTDVVLRWQAPTLNDDQTPLTNLKGFKPYHGSSPTTLAPVVSLNDPSLTCWTMPNLAPGPHYFALMAYTQTEESRLSEVVSKTIEAPPPPPPPPPPVFATVSTVVYGIVPGRDIYAPMIVGSVPLGTPCNPAQKLLAYNVIPRASVAFTGAIQPQAVVALCGP